MIILIVIIVSLIRILKNPKERPIIHVILEKTKSDIGKNISKVRDDLSALESMKKTNLLPKGYYEKTREILKNKLDDLTKQYRTAL